MAYIEYGANILTKKSLEIIPDRQSYSLDDLFVNLVAKKELLSFEVTERFYEIGSLDGLKEFEHYAGGGK